MHVAINVKSPNNISKWQMGFNSAFKGLMHKIVNCIVLMYLAVFYSQHYKNGRLSDRHGVLIPLRKQYLVAKL
jgi:hypothetical protein